MDSPYSRNEYKKNSKSNTTVTQSQTHRTNDRPKIIIQKEIKRTI